jgi:aldose sugar dehydrogenase
MFITVVRVRPKAAFLRSWQPAAWLLLISNLIVIGGRASAQQPELTPVSGTERLAWDQDAGSPADLRQLEHVVYLDGAPAKVDGLRCDATPLPHRFVCSSALPAMAPGDHTIVVGARRQLSVANSEPLRVRVAGRMSLNVTLVRPETWVAADGVRFTRAVVGVGLEEPTDLAALPDGSLLVAERAGRVLHFRGGALDRAGALMIDDCVTATGGGLLALAVDPQFERTRHVYALYTTRSGLRLARYVESGGRLVTRAIIVDDLPVSRETPAATLRIGADRKLYAAIGTEHQPSENIREPLGGKVLRLNLDGTTPVDHVAMTPVIASGVDHPTGLTTRDEIPTVWVSGRSTHNELKPVFAAGESHSTAAVSWRLPEHWGPVKLAAYTGDAVPALKGDLLVAGRHSRGLVRLTADRTGVVRRAEWIFPDELGPIHAIAVAADGSIVVAESGRLIRFLVDR